MIVQDRKWRLGTSFVALAALAAAGQAPSIAQQASKSAPKPAQSKTPAPASAPAQGESADEIRMVQKIVPVKPSDPVAVVNGEVITRGQLADEAIARKGEEILETLIARKLIEQAVHARKIEISAAQIDAEIDRIAKQLANMTREAWLRTLSKERGISPMQYRRDIIFPALALRELAAPRVQVQDADIKKAFESKYGDKLRVRMIMVNRLHEANEIWTDLKKNPAGFERIAQTRSADETTRANGGLFGRPLSRHEVPSTLSDAAFHQLVDGNGEDRDPTTHQPIKPKDGDITGPIQVSETSWIILKREGVIPAISTVSLSDPAILKEMQALMYEALLNQEMEKIYEEMTANAKYENFLTGKVNTVRKDEQVDVPQVDPDVKQMSQDPKLNMRTVEPPKTAQQPSRGKVAGNPNPIGVSDADRKSIERIKNTPSSAPTPGGN